MSRLIFANQLRALAVVSVVFSHLVGVFWALPNVIDNLTFTVASSGQKTPALFSLAVFPYWQPGPFGVALFFLISGFVIPISLEGTGSIQFLVARIGRIYPVAISGQLIGLTVAHMLAPAGHVVPWPDWATLSTNLLLINDWFGFASLDTVNWSLCVEIKFYLFAALCAPVLRAKYPWAAVFLGAACVIGALLANVARSSPVPTMIGTDSVYLSFMAIGMLFHAHLRGRLSWAGLAALVVILSACNCICWMNGPLRMYFAVVAYSYYKALLLFAVLYGLKHRMRPFAPLDRLADISYPIYMTHSVLSYAVMRVLMNRLALPYYAALAAAIVVFLALSAFLHVWIERPGLRWGRRVGRWFALRPGTRPASGSSPGV